jgi:hypothetical protein
MTIFFTLYSFLLATIFPHKLGNPLKRAYNHALFAFRHVVFYVLNKIYEQG